MIYVVLVPFFFQSKDANKLLFSATIVIPAVFFYQIKETGKQSKATGLVLCQQGERIFGNKR